MKPASAAQSDAHPTELPRLASYALKEVAGSIPAQEVAGSIPAQKVAGSTPAQEVAGSFPAGSGSILLRRLILKYFQ